MSDDKPIAWEEGDVKVHLTQCCASPVWIYTDYSEGGELLIPICFECKKRVTLDGEVIE